LEEHEDFVFQKNFYKNTLVKNISHQQDNLLQEAIQIWVVEDILKNLAIMNGYILTELKEFIIILLNKDSVVEP